MQYSQTKANTRKAPKLNQETLKKRLAQNKEIVYSCILPKLAISMQGIQKITGCDSKTLYRVVNRPDGTGGEFRKSGPASTKMSGQDLAIWLNENMQEKTPADYAKILEEIAASLRRRSS